MELVSRPTWAEEGRHPRHSEAIHRGQQDRRSHTEGIRRFSQEDIRSSPSSPSREWDLEWVVRAWRQEWDRVVRQETG